MLNIPNHHVGHCGCRPWVTLDPLQPLVDAFLLLTSCFTQADQFVKVERLVSQGFFKVLQLLVIVQLLLLKLGLDQVVCFLHIKCFVILDHYLV